MGLWYYETILHVDLPKNCKKHDVCQSVNIWQDIWRFLYQLRKGNYWHRAKKYLELWRNKSCWRSRMQISNHKARGEVPRTNPQLFKDLYVVDVLRQRCRGVSTFLCYLQIWKVVVNVDGEWARWSKIQPIKIRLVWPPSFWGLVSIPNAAPSSETARHQSCDSKRFELAHQLRGVAHLWVKRQQVHSLTSKCDTLTTASRRRIF